MICQDHYMQDACKLLPRETRPLKLADSSIIIIFAPNRTIAVHTRPYIAAIASLW